MRGLGRAAGSFFSYVDLEDCVPAKHPLRVIRRIVNDVRAALAGEFAKIYGKQVAAWGSMKSFRAIDGSDKPPSGGRGRARLGNGNHRTPSGPDDDRALFAGSRPPHARRHYDVRGFVDGLRGLNVTPHIAQNSSNRTSAIDARTTRHRKRCFAPILRRAA
jgi:hypothetical protein